VAYHIEVSPEADLDLRSLRRSDETTARRSLPRYLASEPARPSSARKRLDPNPLGVAWELRLGDLRVFYDIDEQAQVVRVVNAGRKTGNDLYIRGVKVEMRFR
jgi:mRNA-degrading endonuclease RelE of RelBE toxin-antitoxin system